MDLADYLRVPARRARVVAVVLAVCVAGAWAATTVQTPVYTTSTRLLVAGDQTGDQAKGSTTEQAWRQAAVDRAYAYAQIATTGPAVDAAVEAAGAGGARPVVRAMASDRSPFLVITVSATSPKAAQAVAKAYADVLPGVAGRLGESATPTPAQLTTVEAAPLPLKPSSPLLWRNLLIGAGIGLLLGLAVALIREALDGRLRSGAEIERAAGVTLLGMVPKEFPRERLPVSGRPQSRRAEAYRQVRTNLEFATPGGVARSIVVTSPSDGEGKSSLVGNLGLAASRAGRSVVIVDADLRKPSIAGYFGLRSPIGLTDVLTQRWTLEEALQPVPGERLWVVTAGPVPSIPSELVGSTAMAGVIRELEQRFDLVIIDAPPVLPVSDAVLLAVNVAGALLVARVKQTTRGALAEAAESIRKVNAMLVGVVGNAAVGADNAYAYGNPGRKRGRRDTDAPEVDAMFLRAAGRRDEPAAAPVPDVVPDVVPDAEPVAVAAAATTTVPMTRRERRLAEQGLAVPRPREDAEHDEAGSLPTGAPDAAPMLPQQPAEMVLPGPLLDARAFDPPVAELAVETRDRGSIGLWVQPGSPPPMRHRAPRTRRGRARL